MCLALFLAIIHLKTILVTLMEHALRLEFIWILVIFNFQISSIQCYICFNYLYYFDWWNGLSCYCSGYWFDNCSCYNNILKKEKNWIKLNNAIFCIILFRFSSYINQIIYSKILIIKIISNLLLFTYILFKIFLFERYGRIISITSLRACRMQTR